MNIFATLLFILLPSLGWGSLLISLRLFRQLNGGWGIRTIMGLAFITLILFFTGVVLKVPLSIASFWTTVSGILILIINLYAARTQISWVEFLFHPIFVFFILLLTLTILHGPQKYLAYSWDEYANWLGVSKHIFFQNALLSPGISYAHPEYTPGWRLLGAYPSLLQGKFNEYHSLFMLSILHFSFLGLVYESIYIILKNRLQASKFDIRILAWSILLLLILAEATWKLIPTDMLVERPQIYLVCSCILILVIASELKKYWLILAGCLGILISFGYLIKSSMIVFLPTSLIIAGYFIYTQLTSFIKVPESPRKKLFDSLLIVFLITVPVVTTYLIWSELKTTNRCTTSLIRLLDPELLGKISLDRAGQLAKDFISAIYQYLINYKLPITLISLTSLLWMLSTPKWRVTAIAILSFCVVYCTSLYWNYLMCGDGFNSYLSSLERYIRIPLRVLHLTGLLFGLILVILKLKRELKDLFGRNANRRVLYGIYLTSTVLLITGTIFQANLSFKETYQRDEEPYLNERVKTIRDELPALTSLINKKQTNFQTILIISDDKVGFDILVARYYTIEKNFQKPNIQYIFKNLSMLGLKNIQTSQSIRKKGFITVLSGVDIIWPLGWHPDLKSYLLKLTNNKRCANNHNNYFIIADSDISGRYYCEKK